jgi:hypothetical protein
MTAVMPWLLVSVFLFSLPGFAQEKRLWVLRAPGEMVEYDPATFTIRQTLKVPPEALRTPQGLSVNHAGQILFASQVSLPLGEEDLKSPHQAWFWNGRDAVAIDQAVKSEAAATGSNKAVTESAPVPFLSADGTHLFWFANQARRLQRDEVDLSTDTTWQAWQTDLNGSHRQEIGRVKLGDCRCATGSCEETCPYCAVWAPEGGIGKFFLLTQFVTGQTETRYEKTTRYQEEGNKWTAAPIGQALERELDASPTGDLVVEAIPDSGCCGWMNQSDDQTLVHSSGKSIVVFDERASYKNPDYDVSFFTPNAKLSPGLGYLAMTMAATAEANQPIQLADEGQANPEEWTQIRKALGQLPAVEVRTLEDPPRRVAFVPHATLVGWISDKELLIIEEHGLVAYGLGTGAHRKSNIKVEDSGRVFLR